MLVSLYSRRGARRHFKLWFARRDRELCRLIYPLNARRDTLCLLKGLFLLRPLMLRPAMDTLLGDDLGAPVSPPDPANMGAFARRAPARSPGVTAPPARAAAHPAAAVRTSEEVERIDEPDGARDYAVHIAWREQGRRALSARKLGGHASPVTSARFTPDGTKVVSASLGRLLRVCDVASAKELFALSGHRASSVRSSSRPTAVTSSPFPTIGRCAWDLQTAAEVARFSADAAMMACAVTPDGRMVAALDTSGIVHALVFER
jgi:hypothetical protein